MRKNTTREMFFENKKNELIKIWSAVESMTGHCYLLADPNDDESPDLAEGFIDALCEEGLRTYRASLRSDDILLKKNRALHSIIAGIHNGKRPTRGMMETCYKYGRIYRYTLGKTNN